jgi:hypothetical protein
VLAVRTAAPSWRWPWEQRWREQAVDAAYGTGCASARQEPLPVPAGMVWQVSSHSITPMLACLPLTTPPAVSRDPDRSRAITPPRPWPTTPTTTGWLPIEYRPAPVARSIPRLSRRSSIKSTGSCAPGLCLVGYQTKQACQGRGRSARHHPLAGDCSETNTSIKAPTALLVPEQKQNRELCR